MTNSSPSPNIETWQVPQCPFVIEYDLQALRGIARAVNDGYRALPHGGLEVGGLLLGSFDGDLLRISGYEPIVCEHANGPSFHLTEDEKRLVLERLQYFAGREGRKVVGWYHSHTRSALSLTPDDLSVHYKLFTEPWQVALLLRPLPNEGARGGFFFREPGGAAIRTSSSYREFTVEQGERDPLLADRGISAPRRTAGPAEAKSEETAMVRSAPVSMDLSDTSRPVPVPMPPPRSRWPVWAALAAMFAVALGAVVYLRSYYTPERKPTAPSLVRVDAIHRNGNIEIRWDTKSLGYVKQGRLDIQDGPIQARLLLDERTLMAGTVSYAYKTDVTGFHLRVERADGTVVEGSTTYVAPTGPESAAAEPEPQKDAPAAEPAPAPTEVVKAEPPKPTPAVERAKNEPRQPAATTSAPTVPQPAQPANLQPATPVQQPQQQPTQVAQVQRPVTVPQTQSPAPTPPQPQTPASTPAQTPAQRPAVESAKATPPAVARPTPPPPTKPAPPPAIQLAGRWVLSPGSQSRSPMPAESIVITVTDSGGTVSGTLSAKYRGAKKGDQNFSFSGRAVNGVAKFPWTSKDGQHGEIEFVRVPGIADMAEVVWYGPDVKQVFDHIVRKVN